MKGLVFVMCNNLKTFSFIKFDILDLNTSGKVSLNCNLQFTSQTPQKKDLLERAILVTFNADTEDKTLHFHIQLRAIYSFKNEDSIPSDSDFMNQYYQNAYSIFCEQTQKVLVAMGKDKLDFPPINGGE